MIHKICQEEILIVRIRLIEKDDGGGKHCKRKKQFLNKFTWKS